MQTRPLILLTRPREDSEKLAAEIGDLGYETFIEPMLEIVPLPFAAPDFSHCKSLIFTSANAVRVFCEKIPERGLPVYAVGPQTKAECAAQRFEKVIEGGGDADSLMQILEKTDPSAGPFLHVRGQDVAQSLASETGFKIDELIVYKAEKTPELSPECESLIENHNIAAVLFFSARTAENFLGLARQKGLETRLQSIKALCISESVLECVRSAPWGGTYIARRPDRQGMISLLQMAVPSAPPDGDPYPKKRVRSMSKDQKAIENAEAVIERFGGIRPMASKIDVPVTTVQGWKKRNVIPGTRREAILDAAREHNISLAGVIDAVSAETAGPANENDQDQPAAEAPKAEKPAAAPSRPSVPAASGFEEQLSSTKKAAIKQSTIINAIIVMLAVLAVVALLWPSTKENDQRIGALEGEVQNVKEEQSFFRGLIPDNWMQQIDDLKEQATQAKETARTAVEAAKVISSDVLAEDAGSLEERVARLEEHAGDLGVSPQMTDLLDRINRWQETVPGREKLGQTVSELNQLFASMNGEGGDIDLALADARAQSNAARDTFQGVPAQDLKAAALLLGFVQFRQSLNRDGQPFDEDLQLLLNLVGEDNPELRDSLTRLAPQAEQGVLTPDGLSNEFRSMAGDIVVSSLKGENVSVQDRARARLNELFAIEKNGELITGTDTQATVVRTQRLLDEGNLEAAINELQTLEGPAAQAAQPMIDKAQMTLLAQRTKDMLSRSLRLGSVGGITASGIYGGSELLHDEESGISILRPKNPLQRQIERQMDQMPSPGGR